MNPNLHAIERYEESSATLRTVKAEMDAEVSRIAELSTRFDELRQSRNTIFSAAFKHVSEALKTIYHDLTMSSKHPLGGNAYLTLDNIDEPYLGGVRFTAMPPMKRFRDMDQLSGGEKTVAALALLFAIHRSVTLQLLVTIADLSTASALLRSSCWMRSTRPWTMSMCKRLLTTLLVALPFRRAIRLLLHCSAS